MTVSDAKHLKEFPKHLDMEVIKIIMMRKNSFCLQTIITHHSSGGTESNFKFIARTEGAITSSKGLLALHLGISSVPSLA